jgi:hypothetical protein
MARGDSVLHIFGTLTANAKRSRKPKGRPITPEELARLFNAVRSSPHDDVPADRPADKAEPSSRWRTFAARRRHEQGHGERP